MQLASLLPLVPLLREIEHQKYVKAYAIENYRMGAARKADAVRDLSALPCRGSYLDVGCGRGEMLREAKRLGFHPIMGTEIVMDLINGRDIVYAEAHELSFGNRSYDVVTMFDVIEHLIQGDDELACKELLRVTNRHILITANNLTSQKAIGDELHINRRSYAEWDYLFKTWFPGEVTWLKEPRAHVSECWRIDR